MKITANPQSLIDAINWATKTTEPNDDAVVLEVDEDGAASLSHLGSSSYAKAPLALTSLADTDPVRLALDGNYLTRLTAGLKLVKGDVELKTAGTGSSKTLSIQSTSSKSTHFNVQIYNRKIAAAPEFVKLGEVNDVEYFESLKGIYSAAAREDEASTASLSSVDVCMKDDKLTLMATNRWALAEVTLDFTKDDEAPEELLTTHYLLPRESAAAVGASKDSSDTVDIIHNEKEQKLGYRFSDGRVILFGLNSGNPIPYARTKTDASKDITREATVAVSDLKARIRMISSLPESDGTVMWRITEEDFEVRDKAGSNSMQVDASVDLGDAESSELTFIQSVLDVAIGVIRTAKVKIKWPSSESHILVAPVLDDGTEDEGVFALAGATSS